MPRSRVVAIVSLVALLVVAGAIVGALRSGHRPRLPPLPRCARPARTIPRPAVLPESFPLPAGTVFTGVDRKYAGAPVVSGRIPLDVGPASMFLSRRLPAAGYTLSYGEQEVGYEAESGYAGNGVSGRFKVRVLFGCHGATRLWIAVHRHG